MKPVLRGRHLLAVAIFVMVAAGYGRLAMLDYRFSPGQPGMAAAALKEENRQLFPCDPVLGPSKLWQLESPLFQGVLKLWLVPQGYTDVSMPFRATVPILTMLYLCGMYALLYRQCLNWSVSAFVAVLSSAVVWGPGEWHWGVGSLGSVTPEALCMSAVPLVMMAYIRYARQWQVLLVFGFVGLMGNLHLITAINLTIILALVHAARERFRLAAVPMLLGALGCAAIGMAPYLAYYFAQRQEVSPEGVRAGYDWASDALETAGLKVLYPELLRPLAAFLPFCAILGVPAVSILFRRERFRTRDLSTWVWFVAAAAFVGLGLHGLIQALGRWLDRPPLTIDFVQALTVMLLPLYILLAQALSHLYRLMSGLRGWLRGACVLLLIGWVGCSDNVRVLRHWVAQEATAFVPEDDKPPYVKRQRDRQANFEEFARLARWCRDETHTDPGAVFLTDSSLFRMLSRRSILNSADDIRYIYYARPWRLSEWAQEIDRAEQLRDSPGSGRGLCAYAEELAQGSSDRARASAWYVVLDGGRDIESPAAAQEIKSDLWGSEYRLFLLPKPSARPTP